MSTVELDAERKPAGRHRESVKVVIIGAGQAGLSVGYHLAKRKIPFVILDANARVGDAWRTRWESLRLFTPAQFDGLDGMQFPAPAGSFPSKDQMADYLATYARRFSLPVRNSVRVDGLSRRGRSYIVSAGNAEFEADQVVVAMSNYQQPSTAAFADELSPETVQIHSAAYRNPSQLRDGPALLVGAGNSGAEIALELSRTRKIYLSGNDVGEVPFRMESFLGRHVQSRLVLRFAFHRLLTIDTPMGRKMRDSHGAAPLIRTKSAQLSAVGVERVAKLVGVRGGKPVLENGLQLDVANLVWCTGYRSDFSWVNLPIFDDNGAPRHKRGVVEAEPGLYFVGLNFLYAFSSTMIHGVGRDARHVANAIRARAWEGAASASILV